MKRIDRYFGHKLWLTPIMSWIGYFALIFVFYKTIKLEANINYFVIFVFMTASLLFGITVGMHRLFCHQSFKTNQFWEFVLAFFATLGCYASTVQWCAMHITHHKYSDTDRDPHYTGLRYLFWKSNNTTEFHKKTLSRLYRIRLHRFFHNFYLLIILFTVISLYIIDPILLIFAYLAPLGWLHLVGSLHQVFAHRNNRAHDRPMFEYIFFTGGEWCHGHHHKKPMDIKFGSTDLGYYIIKLIKNDRI